MASLPPSFLGGLNLRVSAKMSGDASSDCNNNSGFSTLKEYVGKTGLNVSDDLLILFDHLEYAFKRIAALVASPFNSTLGKNVSVAVGSDSERDKPKPLDIVSVCLPFFFLVSGLMFCFVFLAICLLESSFIVTPMILCDLLGHLNMITFSSVCLKILLNIVSLS